MVLDTRIFKFIEVTNVLGRVNSSCSVLTLELVGHTWSEVASRPESGEFGTLS